MAPGVSGSIPLGRPTSTRTYEPPRKFEGRIEEESGGNARSGRGSCTALVKRSPSSDLASSASAAVATRTLVFQPAACRVAAGVRIGNPHGCATLPGSAEGEVASPARRQLSLHPGKHRRPRGHPPQRPRLSPPASLGSTTPKPPPRSAGESRPHRPERRALEPLDRLVLGFQLPNPEATDQFLRLRERTVDHGPLRALELLWLLSRLASRAPRPVTITPALTSWSSNLAISVRTFSSEASPPPNPCSPSRSP